MKVRKKIHTVFWVMTIVLFLTGSSTLADELTGKVDQLFAKWDKPDSPGCALVVVKDGEIVYKKGYGMANLELNVPITPATSFYIGSCSKQFVAFAVALLEAQGKLSFDDDIRKFFPQMPDYGEPVTVRHLLHHTGGIRDYIELGLLAGLDLNYFHKGEEVVRLLACQKELNFKPGERHLYSNSGYLMLAEIVRIVSGQSLRQFAHENIFKPLGMTHSRFHDNYTELLPNRATGYLPGIGSYFNFISTFDLVGSGGLYTTVEDLYLWDQNFYHHKVGGPEVIKTIHTKGILNNKEEIDYAFALGHGEYKGLKTVSHAGGLGGYSSFYVRFPEEKFSVICLSNFAGFNPVQVSYQVADIYLQDRLKVPEQDKEEKTSRPEKVAKEYAPNKPEEYFTQYTGDYYCEELDVVYRVEFEEKKLLIRIVMRFKDGQGLSLPPTAEDEFGNPGIRIKFLRDDKGEINGGVIDAVRVKNLKFKKIR